MINIKNKQKVLILLVVIWAIIIFLFSHQNGEASAQTSNIFVNFVKNLFNIQKSENIENISFAIRKIAHFTIYLVGGILTYIFANTFNIKKITKICYSQLFGTIYSIFDEIHQYFIPARTCQYTDIIIDSCGFFVGILIALMLTSFIHNRKDVTK